MSHESPVSSDSEWDEWEVVQIQTESTTNEAKSKKAKEKDVENLTKEIRDQLTISKQEEKTKLEELNRKLNEQTQISEAKLQQIASQLQSIVKLQQMTQTNHQETNAKLEEANDKLRQIEKETKKQQSITNIPLLSFPSNNTTCMPPFGSLQPLQPLPTLQQQLPTLQQPLPTLQQPFLFHANNNNYNNPNTILNNNHSNSTNLYSTPTPTPTPVIRNNNNVVNNNVVNNNNTANTNIDTNTNNNNRPSTLGSVFNFLLGSANDDDDDDNEVENDENAINEEKCNTLEDCFWECTNCHSKNDEASKYCAKCGIQNIIKYKDMVKNDNANNKPKEIAKNATDFKLKWKGNVGEGKYEPNERRQCGWILSNNTKSTLKIKGYLQKIGGDDKVKVITEKCNEFEISPNDEVYLFCDVVAPNTVGTHCLFYQFMALQDGSCLSDKLKLIVDVKSQFPKEKEDKIENIVKMGFNDRNKVVVTLQKSNWNVQQAVDYLLTN